MLIYLLILNLDLFSVKQTEINWPCNLNTFGGDCSYKLLFYLLQQISGPQLLLLLFDVRFCLKIRNGSEERVK